MGLGEVAGDVFISRFSLAQRGVLGSTVLFRLASEICESLERLFLVLDNSCEGG
jgi:hypothetical protein